jgi:hypothetical protein
MSIGNLNHDNAAEICQKYDPYLVPSLKIILEQGPSGLRKLLRQRGIANPSKKYYSVCEMCYTLRKALIVK